MTESVPPPGGRVEGQYGRRGAGGQVREEKEAEGTSWQSTGAHHRVRESWMALVSAWPRCREPVTFGGGMHIMKIPRGFGADTLERYGEERMGTC